MDLIIGGAFQGKLDYAKTELNIKDEDIFCCTEDGPVDLSYKCIYHLEKYILYCVKNDLTPETEFRQDAVLIGRDISSGIVPMDPLTRKYREDYGRFLQSLARRCDTVTRLFCGLPQKLK